MHLKSDQQSSQAHISAQDGPYADVAIPVSGMSHGKSIYTYEIPERLVEKIEAGQLVWIPLRRKVDVGLVVRLHEEHPGVVLKPVSAIVEPAFRLTEEQLETVRWLAHETASSLYACASPFFPPGVSHRSVEYFELIEPDYLSDARLSSLEESVIEFLSTDGRSTPAEISRGVGKKCDAALRRLEELRILDRSVSLIDRAPVPRRQKYVQLLRADLDDVERAPKQRAALDVLMQRQHLLGDSERDLVRISDLQKAADANRAAINALEKKGLVKIVELLPQDGDRRVHPAPAPVLTPAQARVWKQIQSRLDARESVTMLLQGVTGSGKTELYLRSVGSVLREGRGSIVLVPEIALATQMVERFESRFPGSVAVLHSELSDVERYATWNAIAAGERLIVVGPRSALFAPLPNPGIIVIDEEQDPAYKQNSDPRYHARSLAEYQSRYGSLILMGSATPAVETMRKVEEGEIPLLSLPDRVGYEPGGVDTASSGSVLPLPRVTVVDMRDEITATGSTIISVPLQIMLRETLQLGRQAILLLNRRGSSTSVICRSCGSSVDCPQCDIPFVYHQDLDRLICHRCDNRVFRPRVCAECGGVLDYFGAGTQRIEQEVRRYVPEARVMRVDRDSIKRLGGYQRILDAIRTGETDVVVGTQIVAKGLDFPDVVTVGVLQADSLLHLPDFRSAERTFQLVTQVSGRAGRRAERGRVLVQTYSPDHYAIQRSAHHDYDGFYGDEISFRREFWYPPFSRLIRFMHRNVSEERCRDEAEELAVDLIESLREAEVTGDLLGPAPAFVAKIRGEYQWQIVLRAESDQFDDLLDVLPKRPGWVIDVDPSSLL